MQVRKACMRKIERQRLNHSIPASAAGVIPCITKHACVPPWPSVMLVWETLGWVRMASRGERILEALWKPQIPLIIGFGASQPYSRGKFQETLSERFRGLCGIFPEFLPESPSRTGGVPQESQTRPE